MQVARQMPPKPDFSELESRVRELVDKEERVVNRMARKRGWGRRILLWLFLLLTMIVAVVCGNTVQGPKMYDRVKAIMIRASQISWGESSPSSSPKAGKTAEDAVIIEQLSQQIFEMRGTVVAMQQRWTEISAQNETMAAELMSSGQETARKIKELENMVEILGKKTAVKPIRKNPPGPLILTEPEEIGRASCRERVFVCV